MSYYLTQKYIFGGSAFKNALAARNKKKYDFFFVCVQSLMEVKL